MFSERWMHGSRVTVQDWIYKGTDGLPVIRIGVEHYVGGASRPEWDKAIYITDSEYRRVGMYLDSIVCGILDGQIKPSYYEKY